MGHQDNLAADIRVATERRLKSLEDDLARAELARKERNMATKYHKVRPTSEYDILPDTPAG
jgi:rRNA-processing protein Efg1